MTSTMFSRRSIAPVALATVALLWPAAAMAQSQATPPQRGEPSTFTTDPDEVDPDDALENDIEFQLETNDVTRKYDIEVDADEGVVTISGDVATETQRAEAEELAADVEEVVRVDNEIEIDPSVDETLADRAERGLNRAGEAITDAWITTKVNWFFMGEDVLDGSEIDVSTEDSVVTLEGTVPSEAARTRATALAEMADGVESVRDQLVIGTTP